MNLNALEDFRLVAAHGGFGRASRASGRSKATLSRRVAEFEQALGVRLVERGTRTLELTDAGHSLLMRSEGPMNELLEALTSAQEGVATPRGRLRIAAPVLFSQLALGRLAARFLQIHPDVQCEALADDRLVDLVEEHFDVAVLINPPEDSNLVGRRFARDRLVLAAAPSIAKPRGRQPVQVPAVVMPTYRDGDVWSVRNGFSIEPAPVLRLSSLLMVRDAVAAGAGAALLPQSIVGDQLERRELVSWGAVGDDVELWVLHTSRRLQSPKVRAFVDFLCSQYPTGSFVV